MQQLKDRLGLVSEEFETIRKTVWAELDTARLPENLFHYTSAEGLVGILSSRQFFLTDVLASSDRSELRYGADLVLNVVKENNHPLHQIVLEAYERSSLLGLGESFYLHALSFCESPDSLTQWRAYSTSGGFALGVDFQRLFGRAAAGEFAVARMVYDPDQQKMIVGDTLTRCRATFDRLEDETTKLDDGERKAILNEACVRTGMALLYSVVHFKHPAFASEQEWRVFTLDKPSDLSGKMRYRMQGSRLVPYTELAFQPDLVSEIIRSPGPWPSSIEYALSRLALDLGPSVKVSESTLPL